MHALWIFLVIAALPALYGIHRLCLRLEARGYLYYRDKQPKPGGASPFLLLQEIYQPQISQVIEAEDHSTEKAGEDRYLPDALQPKRWNATQLSPDPDEPAAN
ncbi:MAG TPA: hypothetical protein VHY91_13240 [Pirellulales bacterium]|jgi:hypothetical protein|nr:hypothetical protein [Pirellulales bacterium]